MNYNKYITLAVFSVLIMFASCDLVRDNPLDGKNNESGSGTTKAQIIYNSYSVFADNNGDGVVNVGETVGLKISLKNTGTSAAKGVKATFSSTSSYVSDLTPAGQITYGDILINTVMWADYTGHFGSTESANSYTIQFMVSNTTPAGTEIPINISIVDERDNTWTASFNVTKIIKLDDFEMVFVEGGTFTMGCTSEQSDKCYSSEMPAHQVTVSSFNIGKYELTQSQWVVIMENNPSYYNGVNLPVEQVSWNDVQEFISQLNAATGKQYRLPTEAEWEYAARGGNKSGGYTYSGSNVIDNVAWYGWTPTHTVGTKQSNELGIYDMTGNVFEWCSDWYDDYSAEAQNNPTGPSSGSYRVIRGGSCVSDTTYCRVGLRACTSPSTSNYNRGFRLVAP